MSSGQGVSSSQQNCCGGDDLKTRGPDLWLKPARNMMPMMLTIFLSRDECRLTTVPVATETTCRDVLERCRGTSRHGYTLTELWRGYERVVADGEKMYALLQHWGKEVADVKFYLRYDGDDPPSSPTWDTDQESRLNGVNVPSTTDRMENGVGGSGVELSLSELQEVAERQQQQIEARQQLLASKERRLQQLKQKERRRRRREEAEAGAERLRALRETLAAQEERAGRLRSTRTELHAKRRANEDLALEIERATASFQEKRRELEVAMATVTELSRQLEGLRGDGTGDGFRDDRPPSSSSSAASPVEQELQRLYLDLQSKTTMNQEQSARLQEQTELLGRRTKELAALERQLQDMRGRLRSKKEEALREGPPPHGVNGSSTEARGAVAAPPLTHPGARPTNSLPTLPSSSSSHRGRADEALLGSRKDAGDKIPPVVLSKLKLAPSPSDPDRSLSTPYTHPKIPELKPSTFPPPHPSIAPPTLPVPAAPPLPPLATSKLAPPSKIFTASSQPSQVAPSVLPHPSKIPIAPSQPSQATSVLPQPSKIPTAPSQPSQVISVLPQPSKIPIAPLPATEFASSLPQPSQPQGNVVSRNGLPTLIYVTGSTRPARDAEQEPLKKPGTNGAAVLANAGASAPPSKIPLAVKVTPVPSDVASSPLSPVATTTGAITAPETSASLSIAKASDEPSSTAPRPNPSADGHTLGKYPSVPTGLRFAGTSGGGGGGVGTLAPRPPTLKTPLVPSPGTVFSVYARPSPGSPNFRQVVHQRAVQAETTQRGHGVRPVPFPAVHVKPLVPPTKTEEAPKLSLEHPDGLALSRGGAQPDRPHPAATPVEKAASTSGPETTRRAVVNEENGETSCEVLQPAPNKPGVVENTGRKPQQQQQQQGKEEEKRKAEVKGTPLAGSSSSGSGDGGRGGEFTRPRPLSPTKLLPFLSLSQQQGGTSDADLEALRRRLANAPRPLKKRSSLTEAEGPNGPNLQRLILQRYQARQEALQKGLAIKAQLRDGGGRREVDGDGGTEETAVAALSNAGSGPKKAVVLVVVAPAQEDDDDDDERASVEAAAVSPPQELLSAESFDSTVSESPPPSPLTMEEGDLNAEEDEEEFIPNPYLTAGKADPGSAVVTATVPVLTGDEGPAEEIPDMPQSPPPPYPSSPELDIVPEIISSCGPLPPGKRTNVKKPGSERTDHAMRVKFDPFAILLDSALEGDYDLVNKIFPEVDDPSQPNDEGITALHNAVCAGHMNIVNYLLQAGVNVNAGDSDGWTPLHCAASCNNVLLCKTLVESGAAIFSTTLSDRQTAADKCELMEDGFQQCSQFMHGLQNNLGLMHRCVVYALWERRAEDEDELSFAEDDAMTVLRRGDELEDEWWWARLGEREGYIPRNFVGLFPRIKAKQRAEVP
ncbi:apoptosis-stimulating of p53 protein 1-like isoform X2 [Lethenteron reissneri]|uniref:apoptosis-stimulating of p53 protein 1-like isoform X2 n=1 Tax=Lethenteron reissneri TaxID=7753 RepID=UPI002AB74881|nr:apoptosis-stimulating of p53 protein 1-like isoform X2 [Lethenteron reissneri]